MLVSVIPIRLRLRFSPREKLAEEEVRAGVLDASELRPRLEVPEDEVPVQAAADAELVALADITVQNSLAVAD